MSEALTPGEVLDGKYRIIRPLGHGGMGAVYEGENIRIRRKVAIKVLHAAVSYHEETIRRFEREAQAAAQIGSEHICDVLDLGLLPDGTRFMVMEFLEGETLGSRIKRSGRLPPEQSIPILAQVLDGLGAAHASGIIHRDLKPDNIFILPFKAGRNDFVKILDFGVSKFSQLSGDDMNVTRVGAVVGTPYYMSPEQAKGGTGVDHRSDVYALGVLLYQATTGQVPFQATTFNELMFKIALEPAPPPTQYLPDLDADFASIILKAMAQNPALRYQSCAEFRDALQTWLAMRPWLAGPPPPRRSSASLKRDLATQPLPVFVSPLSPIVPAPQAFPTPNTAPPQTPQLTPVPLEPSGTSWPSTSSPAQGLPQPQTANSWADASAAIRPTRPASKGPLVAVIFAIVTLLCGVGAAYVMFVRPRFAPTPTPAAGETVDTAPPSTATEPVASTEPVEAPTIEPSAEPTAEPSAEPTAEALTPTAEPTETAAPTAPRPTWQRPVGVHTAKPPTSTTGKPKPSTSPTSKPGVPGDFGY